MLVTGARFTDRLGGSKRHSTTGIAQRHLVVSVDVGGGLTTGQDRVGGVDIDLYFLLGMHVGLGTGGRGGLSSGVASCRLGGLHLCIDALRHVLGVTTGLLQCWSNRSEKAFDPLGPLGDTPDGTVPQRHDGVEGAGQGGADTAAHGAEHGPQAVYGVIGAGDAVAKGQRTGVLDTGPGGLGGGGSLLQRVLDGPKRGIGGTGAPLPGRPHRLLDRVN
ncbi:hypothetical protein RAC83_002339, partial [Xylella fastidiosa]|nr:hypothetical protein [Xylella fastidiosa]